MELGLLLEGLFAEGALAQLSGVPVAADAGLAEAVTAWGGDGVVKHIQTDGTLELLL